MDAQGNWKELAAQKEREWKEVTELRIQTLEAALSGKEKDLQEEKAKFSKLKEDFKYNLKVLEERDQELERYDVTFSELKAQLNVKTAEISELKIQLDDAKSSTKREVLAQEDLQKHYQHRIKEKQAEIDSFKCSKDSEINQERKEFEMFKRNLQRQLKQVEDDLDTQKRELTINFEDALKKREHEFRLQKDEMSAKVLEYELKAKLLAKELEIMRTSQTKESEQYNMVESSHRDLEKKLKEKEWELADVTSMKDARISELEIQAQQLETMMNRMKEDFQRKHAELDKLAREKETALTKIKEGYTEREQSLQSNIRELQGKLEESQVEMRKLEWNKSDLEKEKDLQIEKLQEELYQQKERWEKQIVDVSRSQVSKDVELQRLRENEEKLKSELLQRKQDIERYKKDLSLAVERERSMERSRTQLELDWQRRYEEKESNQYEKSEDLIKKLVKSRDEALATVKERDRDILQREALIRALHREREQALATLKKHGLPVNKNINVDIDKVWKFADPEEILSLKEQNESLKSVIKEMRTQMEILGQELPPPEKNAEPSSTAGEYVQSLENEARALRKRNRELEHDMDTYRKYGRAPPVAPSNKEQEEEVQEEVKDNSAVRSHIQSLNDQIGALRSEKIEMTAQLKKQQARIQYLEGMVEKLNKEPRQKQVEIDQLKYELNAQRRRDQSEIGALNQRVGELEIQLVEARKEADEYYKATLERNMEVTSLHQQISSLKVELAEKRPELNFGAQELVIQQLQDEILNLRKGATNALTADIAATNNSSPVQELKSKLKLAAKHIAQLAKERQQLIEMGNKLRAELNKAGIKPPAALQDKPEPVFSAEKMNNTELSQHLSQQFLSKLNQLEKLQYELTKQQLQYAQKFPEPQNLNTNNSTGSDQEYRPPPILKRTSNIGTNRDQPFNSVRESQDTFNDTRRSISPVRFSREGPLIRSLDDREQFFSSDLDDRDQLLVTMSSAGGESLEEVWRMLDRPTPSPFTTPRYSGKTDKSRKSSSEESSNEIKVKGKQPTMHQRSKPESKTSSIKSPKTSRKGPQKSKFRNYNKRDDDDG
ncbi:coiled-coil domain-containing protein 57-like [Crassostrea angulata]|uniref:coiled-coil domain-containing protein 57-like n=1 Tax=Magallana angulata TaxID=2784310 RepID=UPI0022B0933C|nr:coiled-coil domain-containing protein 57-like [Crassostrea angulata]